MIVYKLKCSDGHTFEAWFQSSAAFETQKQRFLLSCPFCTSVNITKAPMSPRLSFRQATAPITQEVAPGNSSEYVLEAPALSFPAQNVEQNDLTDAVKISGNSFGARLEAASLDVFAADKGETSSTGVHPAPIVRQLLMNLKSVVKKHCDDVGLRFAEEARRMHYGETKTRNIYGQASFEEMVELNQEGIDVSALPPFPREDA